MFILLVGIIKAKRARSDGAIWFRAAVSQGEFLNLNLYTIPLDVRQYMLTTRLSITRTHGNVRASERAVLSSASDEIARFAYRTRTADRRFSSTTLLKIHPTRREGLCKLLPRGGLQAS